MQCIRCSHAVIAGKNPKAMTADSGHRVGQDLSPGINEDAMGVI